MTPVFSLSTNFLRELLVGVGLYNIHHVVAELFAKVLFTLYTDFTKGAAGSEPLRNLNKVFYDRKKRF